MYSQRVSGSKMADQRLMCVWQTVDLMDPNHSAAHGTARKVTVKDVTASLSRSCRLVHYSQMVFQDNFPNSVVNFDDYVNYVKVCLRDHSVPFARVEEEFEVQSWEICKESYSLHHCSVMEGEVFQLWQIFNKLCVPGSMPPVIHFDDVQWLGMKFATTSKQRWSILHDGHLTFTEFLSDLDAMCFKSLSHGEVEKAIASVHSWLVREICHTGWMTKRTRKQASWTSWQKRWFVLKPGLLTYYTNATLSDKKGDIILNNKSTLDELQDLKTLLRNYPNRFRITNAPFIEIELSTEDLMSKDKWMSAVVLVMRAAKLGLSPSQVKLADKRNEFTLEQQANDGSSNRASRMLPPTLRSDGEDEDEDELDGARNSGASGLSSANLDFENNGSARSSSSEESKIVYCMIISTISKLTDDAKAACNGEESFTLSTFTAFLTGQEIDMTAEDLGTIFDLMRGETNEEEDALPIQWYVQHLLELLLLEKVPTDPAVCKFLCAMLNTSCAFSQNLGQFEVFIETIWNRQRVHYVRILNEVLNSQGGEGEDTLTLIRQAFSREQSVLGTILDTPDTEKAQGLDAFYSQMKMCPDTLSQYLYTKWEAYPYKGESEKHPNRISQDKSLLDIVFYTNIVPNVPAHRVIENFKWKRPSIEGKLGFALFPNDFDGAVSVANTSQEELLFYGASLASQCQLETSLIYQHSLAAFSNLVQPSSEQAKRPACLHYQNEATLLCPLQEDSGTLIIGKLVGNNTLYMSGFEIPVFNSVYIPRGTIYCVDYTKGIWRKMVSLRAHVDHAQMLVDADEEEEAEGEEENVSDAWPANARKCSFAFDNDT